jgi:uncharacterized CHY-type Zn-finger protein
MKTDCCVRCGQDLRLTEIEWDYQRPVTGKKGELCGSCAAELSEAEQTYWH